MPAETSTQHQNAAGVHRLESALSDLLCGKPVPARLALVTLLARGHLLIEDVPGVGKTTLATGLARAIGGVFRRVQFTADLLPTDLLGVSIFNQSTRQFEYRPGPIFSNVLLADEVNRASPKTQSALLEAMSEPSISVEGVARALPDPFFVVATQNPVEHHGTYPLPESQLDRFLIRMEIGYPELVDEVQMLQVGDPGLPARKQQPLIDLPQLVALQHAAAQVQASQAVLDYVVRIAQATREHAAVDLGLSPRGCLALTRAAKAWALVSRRDYVGPDDVKQMARYVIPHRLSVRSQPGERSHATQARVVEQVLETTAVPR